MCKASIIYSVIFFLILSIAYENHVICNVKRCKYMIV